VSIPRRILLLAQQPDTARRYQNMLDADGHTVQCRELGAGEVPSATSDEFELVIAVLSASEPEPIAVVRRLKAEDNSICVIVVSRNQTVQIAIQAIREGAADYLVEPCSAEELRAAVARVKPAGTAVPRRSDSHGRSRLPRFEGMLGRCAAMLDVFELIERIASAEATVLVTGESGTGKELAVRAIHRLSRRCDAALLGCDCTALAPTLLESELFGHVKGSFSGAIATKKGLFEAADHGTLLLDEVSNLSMETQGKLLRVLETRCIRRVGDTSEREVDIRLIATTNRDLGQMVKVGQFRADLYYRLNVVPVTLPPLRERTGDIRLLAMAFLDEFASQMGLPSTVFSPRSLQQMDVYPWPGNVRELRNIVQRLTVLYGGSQIELEHLPLEIRESQHTLSSTELPRTWDEFKTFKRHVVEDLERRFLTAALGRCAQNVTHAAESVGMQRPNFHALLRHHGLKPGAIEQD
jgi:two-component system, NtrC family, response regulator PilR